MPIEISDNGEITGLKDFENGNSPLLRSAEVTELISSKPSFLVRWGVSILFAIALVLLTATWFIRYPDIVTAPALLNSINSPKEVLVKTPGKLTKLFVKEGQWVKRNELIGFMESTASHEEIIRLDAMLDSIAQKMRNNQADEVVQYLSVKFDQLGELQASHQTFSQSLLQFSSYLQNGFYLRKKKMLAADMLYLQQLHTELEQQKVLLNQDMSLTDSTFQAQESLKNDKVISSMDYRNEKSKLIARQLTLPQINSSIINNESQQHEKQKEIAELENQIQQQKNIFLQSLNTMRSNVEDWKKKYLLRAPVDGKIAFAGFLQENQELKSGQLICYCNPGNSNFYAEALIPQTNFGKVKIGQQVLLKFQAYPYQEFGSVKGEIEFINTISTDSGFIAKISMPEGLVTNYRKNIQYRMGLKAQAEIITADLRLAERFLNTLRKNIRK
ncbi:MAG: HlyD family efflux transporter periplasmic adaptor subunit [Chitinophagaceae bacterium]|jgi:HlyD family secretion protein|nr:HlyD family efflux transporter periplasmic adaptor subunit [Chitinophagaceae bacterium]OQY93592.1 MAG: hypothetical protein B6D37_10885 [Sphingobacteriales bacterium UTBCD1]